MGREIVIINGSPRKAGLTNALIELFITKINKLSTQGDQQPDAHKIECKKK
ncbi:hypothetical protein DSAG12_00072 [Promethearchaeum syntrophicum]|uniref:Uncharacterized protein n=1 Tax=Promethearchaeum syntrophicum TaxID=2594042 RepID=A0A5B9D5P4_9ARCH|nr:hypothetical protein [Candidatus Prometheoarchaeum syntrophicum]